MGGEETSYSDERRQFHGDRDLLAAVSGISGQPSQNRRLPSIPIYGLFLDRDRVKARIGRTFDAERDQGTQFLFLPVLLGIGALVYFAWPNEPSLLGVLAVASLFGVAAWRLRRHPLLKMLAAALLVVSLGALLGKVETGLKRTKIIGSEITTRLMGRVDRVEHQASGRVRLTLEVLATERPVLRYSPDRVRVTARALPEGVEPGDVVQGVVRLIPPSGPVRPNSYDFAFQSYFTGIGAIGFFLGNPVLAERSWPSLSVDAQARAKIELLRQKMAERIISVVGGPEGAIAAALITGIRAGIPEEINDALRVVGLYHVISISGLHMALVGGTLMVTLRCLFALWPAFATRWPVKKFAAVLALAASAFYLLISGADVAAQRSFLMLAVMLLAVVFDRAALTMRNLAISAIIILVISPHEVAGPSFQMSFAATAALVAAYAAWSRRRKSRRSHGTGVKGRTAVGRGVRNLISAAAALAMTSVIAGSATAIFSAWHFQHVSPLGLLANLAAMPIVSVVVMPMAVLASVLMPLGWDALPLYAMGEGIAAMNAIATQLAQHSFLDSTGAISAFAVLLLASGLALLTMAQTSLRYAATIPMITGVIVLLASNPIPDVLVSEDARLVGVKTSDGAVAVNNPRPRGFTIENWQRALKATNVLKPTHEKAAAMKGEFQCDELYCSAKHWTGAIITYTASDDIARAACGESTVLIIADATILNPCVDGLTLVLTSRDLALNGAAEIRLPREPNAPAKLRQAINLPLRPWHDHRRYSRAARGLAEYKGEPSRSRPLPSTAPKDADQ